MTTIGLRVGQWVAALGAQTSYVNHGPHRSTAMRVILPPGSPALIIGFRPATRNRWLVLFPGTVMARYLPDDQLRLISVHVTSRDRVEIDSPA